MPKKKSAKKTVSKKAVTKKVARKVTAKKTVAKKNNIKAVLSKPVSPRNLNFFLLLLIGFIVIAAFLLNLI